MANRDYINFDEYTEYLRKELFKIALIQEGTIKGIIRKVLDKYAKLFFKDEVLKGIGQTTRPKWKGANWEKLSENTIRKKGNARFFKNTGSLMRFFNKKNPTSLYGKSQVHIEGRGSHRSLVWDLFRDIGTKNYNALVKELPDDQRVKLDTKKRNFPFRDVLKPAYKHYLKNVVSVEIRRELRTRGFIK